MYMRRLATPSATKLPVGLLTARPQRHTYILAHANRRRELVFQFELEFEFQFQFGFMFMLSASAAAQLCAAPALRGPTAARSVVVARLLLLPACVARRSRLPAPAPMTPMMGALTTLTLSQGRPATMRRRQI